MSNFALPSVQPLGKTGTKRIKRGPVEKIGLMRPGTTFTNKEDFFTQASHNTMIADETLFILPRVINEEVKNVADHIETPDTGQELFIQKGYRGALYHLECTLEQYEKLDAYADQDWQVIYYDKRGNIDGVLNSDGTTVRGYKALTFYVGQPSAPAMNAVVKVPVMIQEEDPDEMLNSICDKPSWRIWDIEPLTLLTLVQVGSVASNSATVQVYYAETHGANGDGTDKNHARKGMLIAEFTVLDAGSAASSPALSESSTVDGQYDISATTLVATDTIQVAASATNLFTSNVLTLV